MNMFLTCLVLSVCLAAAVPDTKVVRLKRNYEQPHDLEFHAGDDDGLVRVKRQRRDVITTQDEEPSLVRVKRMKRDVNSVRDETEPGLMRVKRDDEELQRVKRTKRDIEQALQRVKRTDDEPELQRVKRNRRDTEDKTIADKAVEAPLVPVHPADAKPQKMLKREKKTNLNHHWQKHEKRGAKHQVLGRAKKNLQSEHRADLLANHALRNIHRIDKRKSKKSRVKRMRTSYNKLKADAAQLGRLRRDIVLNLHKASANDQNDLKIPKHRVKRTRNNKHHKKFTLKH